MYFGLESQAYCLFQKRIKEICRDKWLFMEYEDRISEASFVFCVALRIFSTRGGSFWQDYLNLLGIHMQNKRPQHQNSRYCLSLDKPVRASDNSAYPFTLLDLLIAREPDDTLSDVQCFLGTLSSKQQEILNLLMDGKTHKNVCMRANMTSDELHQQLRIIGEDYRNYSMINY